MDRCPNCKANNPGTSQCRRCGVELAGLWELETKAEYLTLHALRLLLHRDSVQVEGAQRLLARSQALKHDNIVTVLQGFAAFMLNNDTDANADTTSLETVHAGKEQYNDCAYARKMHRPWRIF